MAPAFVFAEQVRKTIRAGKKKLALPDGARISAAAMELIKDHGIEIHYLSPKTPLVHAEREAVAVATGPRIAPKRSPQARSEKTIDNENTDQPSEEMVEEIVSRVIERFYQLKGKKTDKADNGSTQDEERVVSKKDEDLVICRCEEITREEIKETIRNGFRTLNGIKRVTRAGMGLCQGQTCQRLITQILAEELGVKPAEIEPTTARGPVRPIRLAVFANS